MVSESMMLGDWFRSHPKVKEFKNMTDALKFVKEKKKEIRMRMPA